MEAFAQFVPLAIIALGVWLYFRSRNHNSGSNLSQNPTPNNPPLNTQARARLRDDNRRISGRGVYFENGDITVTNKAVVLSGNMIRLDDIASIQCETPAISGGLYAGVIFGFFGLIDSLNEGNGGVAVFTAFLMLGCGGAIYGLANQQTIKISLLSSRGHNATIQQDFKRKGRRKGSHTVNVSTEDQNIITHTASKSVIADMHRAILQAMND